MKPDLASLYSQLNLRPGCSLEEFQRAYRRRIAELHPDRQPGRPRSAESERTLRQLVALYTTVGRFHRRYGRMPGVRSVAGPAHVSGQAPAIHVAHVSRMRGDAPHSSFDSGDERPSRTTHTLIFLFLALLLLVASWSWLTSGSSDTTGHSLGPRPERASTA